MSDLVARMLAKQRSLVVKTPVQSLTPKELPLGGTGTENQAKSEPPDGLAADNPVGDSPKKVNVVKAKPDIQPVEVQVLSARCGHNITYFLKWPGDPKAENKRQAALNGWCPNCLAERRDQHKPRLPPGSRFNVLYDGETQTWSGTLQVKTPMGVQAWSGQKSGVFRLLQALDIMYRRWEFERIELAKKA